MSDGLHLAIPADLLDLITDRVVARLAADRPATPEPWLDVDGAAEHLGYRDRARGRRRVYDLTATDRSFPVHRDGRRLLFKASKLDAWLTTREAAA